MGVLPRDVIGCDEELCSSMLPGNNDVLGLAGTPITSTGPGIWRVGLWFVCDLVFVFPVRVGKSGLCTASLP
jgi:hypothetical protein